MQNMNMYFLNLIPLFPLFGAIFCFMQRERRPSAVCGLFASASVFLSFVCTIAACFVLAGGGDFYHKTHLFLAAKNFTWISAGGIEVDCALMFDRPGAVMLLVVTFVGFLIHVYSIGYMIHDKDFNRFFSYMNLFVFFMIVLVMAKNIVLLFVGWEGVGLCSYLLISFWWPDPLNAAAGKKAFITNRVGDFAFLSAVFILYGLCASAGCISAFDFISLRDFFASSAASAVTGSTVIDIICILLFAGACGKSAQIPLYVWLPDAMAGPTPVSALIHAATMVTAGVYMCVRLGFLFALSPAALNIIAVVGSVTAVFSALIAAAQNDIKKVLAYSTVSQLGFMFIAVGCGAYSAAIFHLTTHAFFKSLLFLAAGSIIHSLSGTQDITAMGGLRTLMPHTFRVFFIGVYAISGLPLMSGFFSKDEILLYSYSGPYSGAFFFISALIASFLTAVYMHRLLFLVFYKEFRGGAEKAAHIHDAPVLMTAPLYILAFFSIFSGFISLGKNFSFKSLLYAFEPHAVSELVIPAVYSRAIAVLAIMIAFAGVYTAYKIYIDKNNYRSIIDKNFSFILKLQRSKFYVDELYEKIIIAPFYSFSVIIYKYIDIRLIDDYIVGGGTAAFKKLHEFLAAAQNGRVRVYLSAMVSGLVVIMVYVLCNALL